jgi:signal transduction histidine kinase
MDRDEAIDRPISEVLQNDEILTFLTQSDALKSNGSSHMETTFPDLSPGEVYQVACSYFKDDDGALIGKMLSIKNITREKATEKATHEFITNVAHEFLTPLTTIKSYNEMLMDGEVEDDKLQIEFYNTISEETSRLSRLIQNLLNLAKIEMGSLTLNTGLVKTDWLVEDCIGAVETNATHKNIAIERKLPDQFPSLIGDKELLKTAIINILGNAVKYSPPECTIRFSMMEEGNNVVFEIIDEGFGISEDDLPHIFDRFYRSKDSNIVEEAGSGLGLAMTLEIIQLHGGEIEVSSELGGGTHFTIRIPKEEYYLGKE